jgi:hypothetical protein
MCSQLSAREQLSNWLYHLHRDAGIVIRQYRDRIVQFQVDVELCARTRSLNSAYAPVRLQRKSGRGAVQVRTETLLSSGSVDGSILRT